MAMVKGGVQNRNQQPHIAFLCSPGMGHIIPMVELVKRFVDQHGFSATLLTFSNFSSPTQSDFLGSLPPAISSVFIPLISLDDLPPNSNMETCLCVLTNRSVPHVRSVLQSLHKSNKLVAFVPDFFCPDTIPIAKELSIPHFLVVATNLAFLAFMLHLPHLDETTTCQYRDLPEPLHLPGCVPLWGIDFIDPARDRTSEVYKWILRLAKGYVNADGFILNSFENMEPETAKAFRDGKHGPRPAYAVGPFVRSDMGEADEFGCLPWLDKQPDSSILFISFGSGGTLRIEQIREIAFGLEESGQRFLWVVRTPNDAVKNGTFFGLGKQDSPISYLPEGFIERTKEVGIVVPSWAPQVKILNHKATGGFLLHGGWNSTLESVSHGVPMISWPLYAEQHMNTVMLVEGIGIALRPKESADGIVERREVARVVRDLMVGVNGERMRNKVKELQEAASSALAVGGASYQALEEVANKLKKNALVSE
ncbi:Glycosyltransferase [Rhynchospora pubera]|uniref:Glycosyltransferase n=1 Tax=Rhynchospora pubera TaxID=906938 RepID=A0AAV8EPN7_9POAL|nr:Glycosyltransferase [Rhynchospora pubera]